MEALWYLPRYVMSFWAIPVLPNACQTDQILVTTNDKHHSNLERGRNPEPFTKRFLLQNHLEWLVALDWLILLGLDWRVVGGGSGIVAFCLFI